ncbi:MAG: hypothetical protein JJ899_18210 [Alphaproteobacteria bacterium]|nr:hypothetical protein [Alphaproteobacteria bacterium]
MSKTSYQNHDETAFDFAHIEARARELQGEQAARLFRSSARAIGRTFRR